MMTTNWTYGSFQDFIDHLIPALDGAYYASEVVLELGGDSWSVGDTIQSSPYTATEPVLLEVMEVDGGTITRLRIKNGGILDGSVAEDGWKRIEFNAGTTNHTVVRFRIEPTGWAQVNSPVIAQTPMTYSLVSAGSGYAVNDKVYVEGASAHDGGNPVVNSAFFNVAAVDGSGAITTLNVFDHPSSPYFGLYENLESGVVALTGGNGGNARINLTIPATPPVLPGTVWVFRNSSTGAQFALHRTDDFTATATWMSGGYSETHFSLALFSMPAYDGTVNLFEQDDVTPGYAGSGAFSSSGGAYVQSATDGTAYITISDRAVTLVLENEWADYSMHAGLLNQFTVASGTNFPMCLYASGTEGDFTSLGTDGALGGLAEPAHTTAASPPGQVWDGTAWQGFSNAAVTSGDLNYGVGASSGRGTWPNARPTYSGSVDEPTALSNDDLTSATPWSFRVQQADGNGQPIPLPITVAEQGTPSESVGELSGPYYVPQNPHGMHDEDSEIGVAGGPSDWSDYFDGTQHTNALGMSTGDPNQIHAGGMLEIKHTDPNSPAEVAYTNLHLTRGSRIILRGTGLLRSHESTGEYFAIAIQDPDVNKANFNSTITMPIAAGGLTTHFLGVVYFENQSNSVTGDRKMVADLRDGVLQFHTFTGLAVGNYAGSSVGAEIPIGTLVLEYGFDGKLRIMYNESATYLDADEWISYDNWDTTGAGFRTQTTSITYNHDRLDIVLTGNDAISMKDNQNLFSYDRNGAYSPKYHLSKQTGMPGVGRGDAVQYGGDEYRVFASGVRQEPTSHYMIRVTS
jgi:hypothetical protein